MAAPSNPHPQGKNLVNISVTQEQLYVLQSGLERMADLEDGEFEYMREVAGNLQLPRPVVTYANMKVT